jgi:transcriptional regulator with XRE-family HTH domain
MKLAHTSSKPQVEFKINRRFLALLFAHPQNQPMVNSVWREIEAALSRKRKTQEWLAGELGLSNNAVSKWKKTGQISRENAKRVAVLLDIPLGKLLLGKADAVVEVLEALPQDAQLETLNYLLFQVGRAEGVYGSAKAASYAKMIEGLKADMAKRKR